MAAQACKDTDVTFTRALCMARPVLNAAPDFGRDAVVNKIPFNE
ncbi:hypothetical protein SAMN04489800_1808 [Pseudomonas deceptionensis]|uniref:Uncharacterized protein n=1 Tax=Pseudomonas deceptionensis TaxID=882211 RepID=A0A1H5KYF1_PSEDM|nr:hypothetical protein SAMN04489800_1808 [Pseudomonas deceptionensis]